MTTAATITTSAHANRQVWQMPDEGAPHKRTWMAFGASRKIWGRRLLPSVRENLALIAETIAQFEPVSMLVRPEEMDLAHEHLGDVDNIELIPISTGLDDLWMRDTAPLFVRGGGGSKGAVGFNFNGWGGKQAHTQDAKVARFVAGRADVPFVETDLVLEGGCLELDGGGTAIATESCILNRNRNPDFSNAQVEAELLPLLGVKKVLWLPGIRGKDITDGHTDFYARFVRPGVVAVGLEMDPEFDDYQITRTHLEMLSSMRDARDRPLEIVTLKGPQTVRPKYESDDFAAGYVGFYVCNGAVIAQEFGDPKADAAAKQALAKAFPDRKVVQIDVDAIAAGGGSIHCATQQEPA